MDRNDIRRWEEMAREVAGNQKRIADTLDKIVAGGEAITSRDREIERLNVLLSERARADMAALLDALHGRPQGECCCAELLRAEREANGRANEQVEHLRAELAEARQAQPRRMIDVVSGPYQALVSGPAQKSHMTFTEWFGEMFSWLRSPAPAPEEEGKQG